MTTLLWAIVAGVYFATGIYFELFFGEHITNYASGAFIVIGGAIVMVVNVRLFAFDETTLLIIESFMLILLALGWIFGSIALKQHIRLMVSIRDSADEPTLFDRQ